jgi:hypothetical protein
MLLLELAAGTRNVDVVCFDDNSVEGKEAEGGSEKNLHEYKGVLPTMRPKVL